LNANLDVLVKQITQLVSEVAYFKTKIDLIVGFNTFKFDNLIDFNLLKASLENSMMELTKKFVYFTTSSSTVNFIYNINYHIKNVLNLIREIQISIKKYNVNIISHIKNKIKPINDFLHKAGFNYKFEVSSSVTGSKNSEKELKAYLTYFDGQNAHKGIETIGKQLSWGEKHSFALILFLLDANSKNADLVILGDPISSFDINKKYAIMNMLFKEKDNIFTPSKRTVLLLTHDFEPLIDYVKVPKSSQNVCGTYIENIDHTLHCYSLSSKEDLLSLPVLMKDLAMDDKLDLAVRIGCLRKYFEYQYKNPRAESLGYNTLSCLIHGIDGKEIVFQEKNFKISINDIISIATDKIKVYISDFDYNEALKMCSPKNLLTRYLEQPNPHLKTTNFFKLLILRANTERSDNNARARLKEVNDVLRKYIDETYHIENDYLFILDVRKFNIVPKFIIDEAYKFVKAEWNKSTKDNEICSDS
jgi:ABC-type dipeptide/oligopeptide/nickel transport system ATPase subunit